MIIKSAPGNKKVFRQIRDIPKSFKSGIKTGNLYIGKDVSKEAKKKITSGKKTGKRYILLDPITGQLRPHQASAPNESPANFSGSLAASINYAPKGGDLIIGAGGSPPLVTTQSGQVAFGLTVDYAKKLELSGRKYLKPAIVEKQKNTENYYYQEISKKLLKK